MYVHRLVVIAILVLLQCSIGFSCSVRLLGFSLRAVYLHNAPVASAWLPDCLCRSGTSVALHTVTRTCYAMRGRPRLGGGPGLAPGDRRNPRRARRRHQLGSGWKPGIRQDMTEHSACRKRKHILAGSSCTVYQVV